MTRLQDKVIIVTGSTSGIGRAIAEHCVREGAQVLVHGIDRAQGEEVAAALGDRAALHLDDLMDPEAAGRIVAAAVKTFGRIDGLVNNAAVVVRSNLSTTSADFFDRVMAVNVRAPLLLIQAAIEELKKTKGRVLNIGSVNAHTGEPELLDYSISKGALQTLSRKITLRDWVDLAEPLGLDGLEYYCGFLELADPSRWPEARRTVEERGLCIPMESSNSRKAPVSCGQR